MSQDSRLGSDPLRWLKERPEPLEGNSFSDSAGIAGRVGSPGAAPNRTVDRMLADTGRPETADLWNPFEILEHLSEALCVCNGEGELIYANPAFGRLSGREVRQLEGLALDDGSLFYAQSQTCSRDVKAQLLSTGRPQRCLIELRRRDDSLVLVDAEFHLGGTKGRDEYFYVFLNEACDGEAVQAVPLSEDGTGQEAEPIVDSRLQAALDAAICLCGHPGEKEADKRDKATRRIFLSIAGQNQDVFSRERGDGAHIVRCFELVVQGACLEWNVDRGVLEFSCQARVGEVRRKDVLLLSYVLYVLLLSPLKKGDRLKACTLRVRVESNGGELGLSLVGDETFFSKKLKLHDKKMGPLQRIAQRIVRENGSILFIRRDKTTEVKINLPVAGSSGVVHEQE